MGFIQDSSSYQGNRGAMAIATKPAIKHTNIAMRRFRTCWVGARNSRHTNTPQNAETIVAPCPMEYEIAGPTKLTREAAKFKVAPVTQIAPPSTPARCQRAGAEKYWPKFTGALPSIGFFMKSVFTRKEQRAVPITKKSPVA